MRYANFVTAAGLVVLLVGVSSLTGCTDGRAPGEAESVIPEAVQSEVAQIGEAAATSLREGLAPRLMAAMAEGGPQAAINVCAVEAMPLTDSIAAASPATEMKRISLRTRNPDNAPDAGELVALEWFAAREAAGERPTSLVQRDGDDYRYYSPLRTATLCVSCHGPLESLAPATRAALYARYPEDQAVGYSEGDLRGLIRVTVPASAVQTSR